VFEREDCTDYQDNQLRHWYMIIPTYVSYGIKIFSPTLQALPTLRRMVTGIPKLQTEHEGICRGCTLGKNTKGPYQSMIVDPKESWI
jgi:hypothetical protein